MARTRYKSFGRGLMSDAVDRCLPVNLGHRLVFMFCLVAISSVAYGFCVPGAGYELTVRVEDCQTAVDAVGRYQERTGRDISYVEVSEDGQSRIPRIAPDGVVIEGRFSKICAHDVADSSVCRRLSKRKFWREFNVPQSRVLVRSVESCDQVVVGKDLRLKILPPCCDQFPPMETACALRAFETPRPEERSAGLDRIWSGARALQGHRTSSWTLDSTGNRVKPERGQRH